MEKVEDGEMRLQRVKERRIHRKKRSISQEKKIM